MSEVFWLSEAQFPGWSRELGRLGLSQCCDAWNKLLQQPSTITSIGMREWAHGS